MTIKRLEQNEYIGKKFTARYKTSGYYDIRPDENGFSITYTPFGKIIEKAFDDEFFGKWLENPVAFGAFEDEQLIGFVEGSYESWNKRFRISNICVFDNEKRNNGIGASLLNAIIQIAKSFDARMVVLETQSCNERAIGFYKKHGFDIIGFDLYSYSNADPERHEVRIEMGMKLPDANADKSETTAL